MKIIWNYKAFLLCCSIFFLQIGNAQELESLLKIALNNNPEVQKFKLQHQVASEKVAEVNYLPNTEIGFGYFISETETRTGAQKAKIAIKQNIPWFGVITARENYLSSLADASYEEVVITKRKLVVAVAQSFYNLTTIKAKKKVLEENNFLLKNYEKIALTAIEVGKASAVDVLKLQIRQNEIKQIDSVLGKAFKAEKANLNSLLNRETEADVLITTTLTIPKEPLGVSIDSINLHPELIKYDKLYATVEKSELINQKERNPSIGFGLDYISVAKRPDLTFTDNGKDILMPMVSLSIPIFNSKFTSKSKQNKLRQKEILADKQNRFNKLKSVLVAAINNREAAYISHELELKNINMAKNAEEILLKTYETASIDFNDVLDLQELILKFEINRISSVQKYYLQTTIINYLTN